MATEVIVALIGATALLGSTVVGVLIKKFDARNTQQHEENKALLGEIRGDIKTVGVDVTGLKVDVATIAQQNRDQDRRLTRLEEHP